MDCIFGDWLGVLEKTVLVVGFFVKFGECGCGICMIDWVIVYMEGFRVFLGKGNSI